MRTPSLFLVAASLALVACGSGDDDPSAATDPAPSSAVTTAPSSSAVPTTVPAAEPSTSPVPSTAPAATAPPSTTPPTTEPAALGRPTVDELIASDAALNIAHAGGDQEWPHSTFYAYDRAVEAGADVLEMDVQLSADGVVVVVHDETVDGTTNGSGRVDEFTFDEFTALDAAHWYVPDCWPCRDLPDDAYVFRGVRTGEVPPPEGVDPETLRIVSFAEMAERYPSMPFDIEIKGTGDESAATAAALATEIERLDLTDHVVVVSFDDATVDLFRELAPGVDVSPGVGALSAWLLDGVPLDSAFRIVQVPPEFAGQQVISPEFWESVASAGISVWVWSNDASTQENSEFYASLIDQGADGIIAGRPSAFPRP